MRGWNKGHIKWQRKRKVERITEKGIKCPRTISIRTNIPVPEVKEHMKELKVEPVKNLTLRLLDFLDLMGKPILTRLMVKHCIVYHPSIQEKFLRIHKALNRLVKSGLVKKIRKKAKNKRPLNYWVSSLSIPMTLQEAKDLISEGVMFGDVYPLILEEEREELKQWFCNSKEVTEVIQNTKPELLKRKEKEKKVKPIPIDGIYVDAVAPCHKCGSQMFIPGACPTCANCGESAKGCG